MTKEVLVDACRRNGGYSQPHLNDQLYLQYKGFARIANLEPYVDLKVLWLEQNAIETIEGLDRLQKLVSLFIQNNCIRQISGLQALSNLRILNISYNFISKLENLRCCPLLETLQASHCRLSNIGDLEELLHLPELSTVDISFNRIERRAEEDKQNSCVVDFFGQMPKLAVLYLHGNEIVRELKNYRRHMIVGLPNLTYLDERPIFPEERRTTEAWGQGGAEAEEAERNKIRDEKRAQVTTCVDDMIKMREATKERREHNERIWNEQQAAKNKWRQDEHMKYVQLFGELDHEEFEARVQLEEDEEKLWGPLSTLVRDGIFDLHRVNKELLQQAAVRVAAEKELRQREEEIMMKTQRERLTREEEMQHWVRRFAEDDALLESELQSDLDSFLNDLVPGAATTKPRMLSGDDNKAVPEVAPAAVEYQGGKKSCDEEPDMGVPSNFPLPSATTPVKQIKKSTPSAAKPVTTAATGNKFDVWEKYYAFEQAAAKKFAAKKTAAAST